jgi:hypothetical protein
MSDEETNTLVNHLLSVDDTFMDTSSGGDDPPLQLKTTPCSDVSFFISETVWTSVSWQLELARRILNYSTYSLAIFDIIYLIMLTLEIVANFEQWSSLQRVGGLPFQLYFVIFFFFNAAAPPLGMHLIKSILLHPAIPKVFQQATKYDSKFHFRMHCLAHFNCAASFLAVLLSFFTNPLYRSIQLPFLFLYVVPLSFTLSVVVCLLEGHRLLACQFNKSLQKGTLHLDVDAGGGGSGEQASSEHGEQDGCSLLDARKSIFEIDIDVHNLRNQYYDLHLRFDLVRKHWGLYLLFIIIALLLNTAGLVWYSYISDFNRVKFSLVLPYIIIAFIGVCEVMFSLTLANELGAKISKTLAKFMFKQGQRLDAGNAGAASITAEINNLLILSQIVLVEIPFVEGFSLRVRLTAMLVGPLIGAIVPKLFEK